MKYIIGNWKAYKTAQEVSDWLEGFQACLDKKQDLRQALSEDQCALIICPPYHVLNLVKEKIAGRKNISVGSQDVSLYDVGKYTGEIPAQLLSGIVTHSIVGHSERRSLCRETDTEVETKVSQCCSHDIEPIVCVRGPDDLIPDMASIVAYEPVESIGTGANMPAEEVIQTKRRLSIEADTVFLYGGSVTRDNCAEYVLSDEIDGLLIGSASLDPEHFLDIASYVTT